MMIYTNPNSVDVMIEDHLHKKWQIGPGESLEASGPSASYIRNFAELGHGVDVILTITHDDGTPAGGINTPVGVTPRTFSLALDAGTTFDDDGNSIDIVEVLGRAVNVIQVIIGAGAGSVEVMYNGDENSTMVLAGGASYAFGSDDGVLIGSVAFDNSASGNGAANITVVVV